MSVPVRSLFASRCQRCLETFVSGSAPTAEHVRLLLSGNSSRLHELCAGDPAPVSCETLGAAARAGDPDAPAAFERVDRCRGQAAAAVVMTLHPDLTMLGGGVAALDNLLIDRPCHTVAIRGRMFPSDQIRIQRSQRGTRVRAYGGLAAAMRRGVQPIAQSIL